LRVSNYIKFAEKSAAKKKTMEGRKRPELWQFPLGKIGKAAGWKKVVGLLAGLVLGWLLFIRNIGQCLDRVRWKISGAGL
jgi:hypothetical protein